MLIKAREERGNPTGCAGKGCEDKSKFSWRIELKETAILNSVARVKDYENT